MIQHVIKKCRNPKCGRREFHFKRESRIDASIAKITLICLMCKHEESYIVDRPTPKPGLPDNVT